MSFLLDGIILTLFIDVEMITFSDDREGVKLGAEIHGVSWNDKPEKFDEEDYEFYNLSDEELDSICYNKQEITLTSPYHTMSFNSDKGGFTVRELLDYILIFELKSRQNQLLEEGYCSSDHISFSGIHKVNEGIYEIYWSS